jgi:hypothetical protein
MIFLLIIFLLKLRATQRPRLERRYRDTTGLLQKQSVAMADTLQSNIQNLQTAFYSFADSNLTKPLEYLTNLLNKLAEDPERIKKYLQESPSGLER